MAALGIAGCLGAELTQGPGSVEIRSPGLAAIAALEPGPDGRTLDCGESGLCLRMFTPIAALLRGGTRLVGRGSLAHRPVTAVEAPLMALGGSCATADGFPPVVVEGPIAGGEAEVDASASSQFLTGLLIALPLAARDSTLHVRNAVSQGYLGLTLRTMAQFGVHVAQDTSYERFSIGGRQSYRAGDFTVEGDWSGAAFLLVAAAIAGRDGGLLEVEGLQADSAQPDRAVLEVLAAAGAGIAWKGGLLEVGKAGLRAFDFDASACPDLFPPLAALALACEGVSTIRGAHRLRGKESDRASALQEELGKLGARIEVDGDLMRIAGGPLHGGELDARGDHRIAMAAAVAALTAGGEVRITGAGCVAKSWPSFFADLEGISHARQPD